MDGEVELLRERHLEYIPNLAHYWMEANVHAKKRMAHKATKWEDAYQEDPLGPGDFVLRKNEASTKLHLWWDGPFMIKDLTDKNVFQLQTWNGYVLCHLYNHNWLRQYFPSPGSQVSLWFASSDLKKKDSRFREQQNRKNKKKQASVRYAPCC